MGENVGNVFIALINVTINMGIRVLDKREINDARHIIKSQWGKTYSILFFECV